MSVIAPRRRHVASGDDVFARLQHRAPAPIRNVHPETPLSELPLDSLDLVELLCVIEEDFGVRLTEAEFQRARTVADLAAAIAGAAERR